MGGIAALDYTYVKPSTLREAISELTSRGSTARLIAGGTDLILMIQDGLVAPGRLCQIGIRGSWGAASDGDLSARHGGRIVDVDELSSRGPAAIAAEIREIVGDRPAYLTFDVDAVDPAFAPGTGTPVPGGLSAREALALVRALAGVRLVGMDVVEVAPALDHADLTAHLAAHLLFEGLALGALSSGR